MRAFRMYNEGVKKIALPILFASFALLAAGLGSFKAVAQIKEARADSFSIDFDGSSITVGSYPNQMIVDDEKTQVESSAKHLSGSKYEYSGNYYTPVDSCEPYSVGIVPPGVGNIDVFQTKQWFRWEPLTWAFVKEVGNVSYFLCKYVPDVARWQTGSFTPANDWENSTMRIFLNGEFYQNAFSDEERQAVVSFTSSENTSKKAIQDNVSLITKSELSQHSSLQKPVATGYAIVKSLFCKTNENDRCVYYLNSIDNTTDPAQVDYAEKSNLDGACTVNETTVRKEIGVRPLIAVKNSALNRKAPGGGGGGGGSKNVNVPLIIGIIFSVFGMAGLAVFFMLWKKGKLIKVGKTKAPIWLIASISSGLLISIIGICLLFAGTAGGGGGAFGMESPVGYWSTPEFTLDTGSSDFGYAYYMGIARNGNVYRYYGDVWGSDSIHNYPLELYDGVGSWELKNGKLVIHAAPSWPRFQWEELDTTYYPTNGRGYGKDMMIMNEGSTENKSYVVSGYRWYHSSTVDPTGESVMIRSIGIQR